VFLEAMDLSAVLAKKENPGGKSIRRPRPDGSLSHQRVVKAGPPGNTLSRELGCGLAIIGDVKERVKAAWKHLSENQFWSAMTSGIVLLIIGGVGASLVGYCTTPSGTTPPPAPIAQPASVPKVPAETAPSTPFEVSQAARRGMEELRVKHGVRKATRAESKAGLDGLPIGTWAFVLAEDVGMRIRRPTSPTKTSDGDYSYQSQYFEVHVAERGEIYLAGFVTLEDKSILDSVYATTRKRKPISMYHQPDGDARVAAAVLISDIKTQNFRKLRRVEENEYFVAVFDLNLIN
jgi:hypothetical protein